MRMMTRLATSAALCLALAACGGDDGPTGSSGGKSMSATISGEAWTATALGIQGTYTNNVLAIGGSNLSANARQINIVAPNVTSTGTYAFGPGNFATATITFVNGTTVSSWVSSVVGGGGSLVVEELDATHAKGTFTITAGAGPGTAATGTKTVTSGKFNIKF